MKEFAMYTDARAMQTAFAQYLPGLAAPHWKIEECFVRHVWQKAFRKHKENSFITVLYELRLAQAKGTRKVRQWLYAKAFLNNQSRSEFNKHLNALHAEPSVGIALSHLAALDMVVWNFPNDPAMPQLAQLIDAARVQKYLPYDVRKIANHSAQNLAVQVLNYRPEKRCTAQYEWVDETTNQSHAIIGKTFADAQGATIYRHMQHLRQRSDDDAAMFSIAQPLQYDPALFTIWQEYVSGESVAQNLTAQNYEQILTQIAQGLAAFHRSALLPEQQISPANHLAECAKKTAKLSAAFPALQSDLSAILQTLQERAPAHAPSQLIHGDFHLGQLKRHANRIALFDFDELASGDPLQDVANFCADFTSQNLSHVTTDLLPGAFLSAYKKAAPEAFCAQRLAWHLGVQFLTRAYRCWWQQKPDLARRVEFYLELAKQNLLRESPIA